MTEERRVGSPALFPAIGRADREDVERSGMAAHRIFRTSFASVYPLYVAKAEKKGRRRGEVDEIICWLTGYSTQQLQAQLHGGAALETFFAEAPATDAA